MVGQLADHSALKVCTDEYEQRTLAAGVVGAQAGAEEGMLTVIDPLNRSDLLELAERLPVGSAAAVFIFEQSWAGGLTAGIPDSAGTIIIDEAIHAEGPVNLGFELGVVAESVARERPIRTRVLNQADPSP